MQAENKSLQNLICEGSAEILSGGQVFYNPVQEFNRDLSICVLNTYFARLVKERIKNNKQNDVNAETLATNYVPRQQYNDGLRILEALSATGLRSIRYAKEIAGVRQIIANDLSKQAVQSIKENVQHNGVEQLVEVSHADAMTVMYLSTSAEKRFDAIDLDPYGCPSRFLDGAVQSLADGGLLLVTATDMAVLAGNSPEACYVKYSSVPLRSKSCHEMALRILLNCIETHANRYGKYIEPLLCLSADFYIRVFLRVHTSQARCKLSMSKQSMVYQCTGCDSLTLQPLGIIKPNPTDKNANGIKFGLPTGPPVDAHCAHCRHKHHLGGPIWSAPLHDFTFVEELLDKVYEEPLCNLGTQKRIIGMLTVVLEELPDVPLYYRLDKLCCVLKLQVLPMLKFRSALLHAGYRVSYSHAHKNSIKTDAPNAVIWEILRCWAQQHPVKPERLLEGTATQVILSKSCEQQYNFEDMHPEANPYSRRNCLSRFQRNPAAHWGPGTRATIMVGEDKLAKSVRNQGKKQKQKTAVESSQAQVEDAIPVISEDCDAKRIKLTDT